MGAKIRHIAIATQDPDKIATFRKLLAIDGVTKVLASIDPFFFHVKG